MEILTYLVPAAVGILLWIAITEILDKFLHSKNDEVSRIKKASRMVHSHEDHNTRFRRLGISATVLWEKDRIDPVAEDRMRQSVRMQVKGKEE